MFTCCFLGPSQQPPPYFDEHSKDAVTLKWNPPDYPNGEILNYTVYRDGEMLGWTGPDSMYTLLNLINMKKFF